MRKCTQVKYGGCHPTENSFDTKLECENFCPHIGPPIPVENEPCLTNETQPGVFGIAGGQPCIFPFKFKGIEYNGCILHKLMPSLWCPTYCSDREECEVDEEPFRKVDLLSHFMGIPAMGVKHRLGNQNHTEN